MNGALMLDWPKSILQSHTASANTFCHVTSAAQCTIPLYSLYWYRRLAGRMQYGQIFTSRQHPRSVSVVARVFTGSQLVTYRLAQQQHRPRKHSTCVSFVSPETRERTSVPRLKKFSNLFTLYKFDESL